MLNRTNRTLSANLLRLNLGTRSLAIAANVNNGAQTLRTRHAHRVVMRDGMPGYQPSPIPIGTREIPEIPGSPAVSSWLPVSPPVRPRAEFVATLSASTDRSCSAEASRDRCSERDRQTAERVVEDRKPFKGKRFQQGADFGQTVTRTTLATQAAIFAAVGG